MSFIIYPILLLQENVKEKFFAIKSRKSSLLIFYNMRVSIKLVDKGKVILMLNSNLNTQSWWSLLNKTGLLSWR